MPKPKTVLVLLLCVLMLAACGKKGTLKQPDNSEEYPRDYPTR